MGLDPSTSIELLYRRYGAVVYRRARTLLGDEDLAWDVVQEIFMQMLRGEAVFRHESAPTTWLYRVTTNRCLNMLRDSGRHARRLEIVVPGAAGADDGAPPVEARIAVQQLARHLDAELCELAVYAFVDHLSQDEIGQVAGLSRKTVGRRLQQFCEQAAVLFDQRRKVTA